MEGLIPTLVVVALMAVVVLGFRAFVRRPAHVSAVDPPGVRTVVVFAGSDAEFFADDCPDEPLVGVRLFRMICDGLAKRQIGIDHLGTIQNAQRAECVVAGDRFALVLEWIDGTWAAGVEWVPESAAEKRHVAWTSEVFAPSDGPNLRCLLSALDRWIKDQPKLSQVRWYRKENWIAEDLSDPGDAPFD